MSVTGRARRALAALLAAGVTVAAFGAASTAGAEPSRDERRRQLQELIGEVSEDEAAALAELAEIQDRREALDAAVVRLDAEVATAEAELASQQETFDLLTANVTQLDARLRVEGGRVREARNRFERTAAALYRTRGASAHAYAALLIGADGPDDLVAGSTYLERISVERKDDVDALTALRDRIERIRRDADTKRARANEARRAAAAAHEQVALLRAQQAERRADATQQESRERALVASIRAKKDVYTAELAALESSSNSITTMLQARQSGQQRAASFSVQRPVPGAVTSGFGPRVHPILGGTRMHNGVDMHAGHGSPIKAGAAGVVAWSGPRQGYGNTVIVDHGNQYATLYAHASVLLVKAGQRVAAGETVALVGDTGLATAPHLHFEVRLLGIPVNPVTYMG